MVALSAHAQNQARSMILLIFLIQLVLCVAANSLNEVTDAIILQKKGGGEQREFDYFKLALQWPGTMCRGIRHCCSSNGCCDGWLTPFTFVLIFLFNWLFLSVDDFVCLTRKKLQNVVRVFWLSITHHSSVIRSFSLPSSLGSIIGTILMSDRG